MSLFGPIIIPFQGLIRQFVIFATYNVISQMEFLDFFSFSILIVGIVFGIGFWGLVLVFGGILFRESKKTGLSWKCHGRWKRVEDVTSMKKFVRSCQPLYIGLPGYFKVTHMTFLNFLRALVQNIFRALLTFR
jgi:hypothetical protein